jgi:UDP-glucose 4-epimerase
MNNRILVTGFTGFIGTHLAKELTSRGASVRGAVRFSEADRGNEEIVSVGDIGAHTDWSEGLKGVDTVIHCAARAHVMNEIEVDPLTVYRNVNVSGTRRLAEQAADMGVRRFIYLSSIKVNGEFTKNGEAFKAADAPKPEDAYAVSKMESERDLFEIAKNTGMEVVCIRPPLVYGPGVKGNFLVLLRWLKRGVPLPLGAVYNRRSFVALDNLVDLIITCINHPAAANQSFLVSDDDDLSTTELLRRMGDALNRPARLIPVPSRLLYWGAKLTGKDILAQRLLDNLHIDISKTKDRLGWEPLISFDTGLRKTAEWYLNSDDPLT